MPPDTTTAVATREEAQPFTLQEQITTGLQAHKGEIRAFLPDEAAQRRFMRIVLRALDESPRLRNATPNSIVSAAIEAAMYGLEPSGHIGGAHLVPFRNSETGQDEAQLITDYRGDVHLARQSKEVVDAYAEVVRKADRFIDDRAQANVIHEPDLTAAITNNPDEASNPIIAAYSCIVFTGGFRRFTVMTRQEIETIRAAAPGRNSPAWRNHWPEMAKKTVLKRGLKTAPLPPMVRSLISREDTLDYTQPIRATVERPASASLGDRLEQRRLGTDPDGASPGTEPRSVGGGVSGGEPSPAGEAVRSGAASPTEQPRQDAIAVGTAAERVGTPASVSQPEEGEGAPDAAPPQATEQPPADGEGARVVPTADPPPAASRTLLDRLLDEPTQANFLAFALDVLGMEDVELADLNDVELGQVIAEAVDGEEEWANLYRRLPAVVKARIRAQGQHPSGRKDRPAEAFPERPSAEQLRAALGGSES